MTVLLFRPQPLQKTAVAGRLQAEGELAHARISDKFFHIGEEFVRHAQCLPRNCVGHKPQNVTL